MFTGIIESIGKVKALVPTESNLTLHIQSSLTPELKVDQSVSHNGVCLTVEIIIDSDTFQVTAVNETLSKTNLGILAIGSIVNLERCLKTDGRLDGHYVQGHVDGVVKLKNIEAQQGSWILTFNLPSDKNHLIIEKGSVALNGISLTAFNVTNDSFSVAIIPFTWEHTNIHQWKEGDSINIEYDILGKYLFRFQQTGKQ